MKRHTPPSKFLTLAAAALVATCGMFMTGCESDDGHPVKFDASGKYVALSGKALLTPANTGTRITAFTVVQNADRSITVTDSNGNVYTGSVSGKTDTALHFKARGTVGGVSVEIKGLFDLLDNTVYISGTYKEKNGVSAALSGKLAGAKKKAPDPVYDPVTLDSPGDVGLNTTRTYTALNGSGDYAWTFVPSTVAGATFSPKGTTAIVTVGGVCAHTPVTITVTDNKSGHTASASIYVGEDPPPPPPPPPPAP